VISELHPFPKVEGDSVARSSPPAGQATWQSARSGEESSIRLPD